MLVLSACNSPVGQATSTETSAALATEADTETPIPTEPSPTTTDTTTASLTPTTTLTPTPLPPSVQVSANTHCRSGPGLSYDSLGILEVGQSVEILAKSTIDNYWYVSNPQNGGDACWISGLYAEVVGDTTRLESWTPVPSPTPQVGFDLYLRTFESCGSTFFVVFSVRNGGAEILKSGNIEILEDESGDRLYGPAFQRFPFAEQIRPVCPPGHGNELFPGQVQYIHVPIDPVPHGEIARGVVKLCTADYQGGICVTKTIWFQIE